MKQAEILTHATHVNVWFPAVYMSCMSKNSVCFTYRIYPFQTFQFVCSCIRGHCACRWRGRRWRRCGPAAGRCGPQRSAPSPGRDRAAAPAYRQGELLTTLRGGTLRSSCVREAEVSHRPAQPEGRTEPSPSLGRQDQTVTGPAFHLPYKPKMKRMSENGETSSTLPTLY